MIHPASAAAPCSSPRGADTLDTAAPRLQAMAAPGSSCSSALALCPGSLAPGGGRPRDQSALRVCASDGRESASRVLLLSWLLGRNCRGRGGEGEVLKAWLPAGSTPGGSARTQGRKDGAGAPAPQGLTRASHVTSEPHFSSCLIVMSCRPMGEVMPVRSKTA